MIKLVMRKNGGKLMAIRGGHGWDRPDVPLTIPYEHKRRVDVFDTNLWYYCGVMPEYFINQNETYLYSPFNAAKQAIIDGKYIFAAFVACYFMHQVLFEPKFWNISPDHLNNSYFNYPKKVQTERPHLVKHFLDLSVTGDLGMQRITSGEQSYFIDAQEIYIEQNKHVQQINSEGKNFIERVETESRQKVNQRHGLNQQSSHGHH